MKKLNKKIDRAAHRAKVVATKVTNSVLDGAAAVVEKTGDAIEQVGAVAEKTGHLAERAAVRLENGKSTMDATRKQLKKLKS